MVLASSIVMGVAMSMDAVVGSSAASPVAYQPAKAAPQAIDRPTNQAAPPVSAISNSSSKISPVDKKPQVAAAGGRGEPVRAMNHVVEVYNIHGKARTRFLDSHNNLIYQIPSEMKAKMEDLMMKPDTSADIKG